MIKEKAKNLIQKNSNQTQDRTEEGEKKLKKRGILMNKTKKK